jgi:hypothetical protein
MYFIIVILIYIIKNKAPKTRIIIKVIIKIRKGKYKVKVLINLDIKANYIKKKLALNISILLILEVIFLALLKKEFIYIKIIISLLVMHSTII